MRWHGEALIYIFWCNGDWPCYVYWVSNNGISFFQYGLCVLVNFRACIGVTFLYYRTWHSPIQYVAGAMAMAAQLHIEWWSDTYNYTNNFYDFTDETTSTKEYEPGTCCRAVDGSSALEWPKSRFAYHCKRFFPCRYCRGVLGIVITCD